MKKTKVLFLILFLSLIMVSVVYAGGQRSAQPTGALTGERWVFSPNNPVTISVWMESNQMAPAPDNKISALLRDRLGVTLEYDITPPGMGDQRIGVMLASGLIPDLVASTDLNARLVHGGALLRLDDALATGNFPNLAEHVRPVLQRLTWRSGGVPDGLYLFPNYNRFYGDPPIMGPDHGGTGFWIQKAVLEWHNFPALENMTLERYFQLLEDYMRAHPTIDGQPTIAFTFPAFQGRVWGMTNPPNFLAGHPNNGPVMIENGVARIYANTRYAYDYFRFLNLANARGLVDPEAATQTQDQYLAKLATGRVLGMHDQGWGFGDARTSLQAQFRDERTWVATMPVFPGYTPYYADRPVMNVNQGYGISRTASNPNMILSFLEEMMSVEWQTILSWGIEGQDYHVGPNGMYYRTQQQRDIANDVTWRQSNRLMAFWDPMSKRQGTLPNGNAFAPGDQPSEFFDGLRPYDRSFLQRYNRQTWTDFVNPTPENPVYYPAWQAHLPDGSAAQIAQTQLDEVALQFLPRAIFAPPAQFDVIWNEYLAAINRIDVRSFEEVFNQFVRDRMARGQ